MESFGILIEAEGHNEFFIKAKFLSDGREIGTHNVPGIVGSASLREHLGVMVTNWMDSRVYRNPQKQLETEIIDVGVSELGTPYYVARIGGKKVDNRLLPKSPTDDQSICEHTEPESVSGELSGDILLGGSVTVE